MRIPILIQQRIERRAAEIPDAVALSCGERRVSYGELNARANQLARRLRGMGVGPEVVVGVSLERSIDVAVVLLGVLKAGGAYVYLDPAVPRARLEYLVKDSGLRLVVTRRGLEARVGAIGLLEIGSAEVDREDAEDLPHVVTPDSAAYILYTSGSTGTPKGAVEVHRCLTARLDSGEFPDMEASDVCALNSSFASGITASRLFLPLALGARVAILAEDEVRDPQRLVAAIEEQGITSLYLPPVLLRTVLNLGGGARERLKRVRAVTTTGSAQTAELAEKFFEGMPGALFVNVYGSTEIGTTATLKVVSGAGERAEVSIGRAVANTRLYLLDEERAPVTDGEVGEIYVGSRHLARGYLNQPELTAERFLADPLAPGERMYRTGDLGRRMANGEIQFLGRRDHQVKVRGFRVELGEIEAVLQSHEQVLEAVVTAQVDTDTENRLIAYFVAQVGREVSSGKLRRFLTERLPEHMVPQAFVRLVEMPRTVSGKADRQALPVYDPARPERERPYEAPRNGLETGLVEIWSEVLKVKDVGIHDDFLDLGGDSLAATRVIVRIRDRFELELTLETVFDQTILQIAARAGERGRCVIFEKGT